MIDTPSLLLGPKVQGLFARALAEVQRKGFSAEGELVRALRVGNPWAHSLLRYALAQELCTYLGRICPGIRKVYVYGSTVENRAGPASDVDLILWVQKKSGALESLLWQVDTLLLRGYRALTGFSSPKSLFDLHIVDDEEVAQGKGYGSVINSLWTAPVPLQLRERKSLESQAFT
ncbi:nucleotidyltransferase domain-containing protein [Candidatus Bipolaricaulota bacterium]|nr:nucleotidyltransferase domain-containing protein [Candidatus Bipolaricaulota bacterium]